MRPHPPIACSLTAGDYRRRAAQWREVLADGTPTLTADNTVRTTLPLDRLPALAALVAAEIRCCPFFIFRLVVTAEDVQLDVRAPADATPLLDDLFSTAGCAPRRDIPPVAAGPATDEVTHSRKRSAL